MQVIELPEEKFEPMTIAFSPDGRLLAAWAWGRAGVLDTTSGAVRGVFGRPVTAMNALPGVGFTADSRCLVSHRHGDRPPVAVYDLDTGEVLRRCPEVHGRGVEVGPGGRLVYLTHRPAEDAVEIVRWDPLTGATLPPFARHKGFLLKLAVSTDAKWVAGSSSDTIRLWNLGGEELPSRASRVLQLDRGHVSGLVISGDGAFVAFCGRRVGVGVGDAATGELWHACDQSTTHTREVAFHPSRPLLAFSGGGSEVAFYDAAARAEVRRFAWGADRVTATAFSPDGLRCAAASAGRVVIWDVDV
jgi:WD40 repeat protein